MTIDNGQFAIVNFPYANLVFKVLMTLPLPVGFRTIEDIGRFVAARANAVPRLGSTDLSLQW